MHYTLCDNVRGSTFEAMWIKNKALDIKKIIEFHV
jgi:hypothetical protein